MPRLTAAHEQAVRDRIVAAAMRTFADRGFHRATMQDVVRESGLSIGAIYTHFRSKDELFLAGCDLAAGRGMGELAQRLARGGTTVEKLAIAISFFFDAMDGPATPTFLIQAWAEADQDPAVREMLVRRREQLATAGQLLLREGIARGEIADWIDVDAVARAYGALLDGLLLQRVEAGTAFRRREVERRARAILELVVASAGTARPSVPVVEPEPFEIQPTGPSGSTRAAPRVSS